MVERSLSMREAPGSIPGLSIQSLSVRLGLAFCSIETRFEVKKI
jgi:hypothetical protein